MAATQSTIIPAIRPDMTPAEEYERYKMVCAVVYNTAFTVSANQAAQELMGKLEPEYRFLEKRMTQVYNFYMNDPRITEELENAFRSEFREWQWEINEALRPHNPTLTANLIRDLGKYRMHFVLGDLARNTYKASEDVLEALLEDVGDAYATQQIIARGCEISLRSLAHVVGSRNIDALEFMMLAAPERITELFQKLPNDDFTVTYVTKCARRTSYEPLQRVIGDFLIRCGDSPVPRGV